MNWRRCVLGVVLPFALLFLSCSSWVPVKRGGSPLRVAREAETGTAPRQTASRITGIESGPASDPAAETSRDPAPDEVD